MAIVGYLEGVLRLEQVEFQAFVLICPELSLHEVQGHRIHGAANVVCAFREVIAYGVEGGRAQWIFGHSSGSF
jgi:hypothetical protein